MVSMVLRISPWFLVAVCVACSDSAAPHGRADEGRTRQAITGGDVDPATRAVHSLRVAVANVLRQCTATRIAADLFVTARHCLVDGDPSLRCGERFPDVLDARLIELTSATHVDSLEALDVPIYRGSAVRVPADDQVCGADLALVVTEDVAELEPALAPRLDPPPAPGDVYAAVGYGIVGVLVGGEGTRRRLDDREVECVGAICGNLVTDREFLGSGGPCEGDSGGPALIEGERGAEVLGVLSRGTASCERSVYTSLAAWSDFLRDEAHRAARAAGYAVPAWAREPNDPPPNEPDPSDPEDPPTAPPRASAGDPEGCHFASAPDFRGTVPGAVILGLLVAWGRRRAFPAWAKPEPPPKERQSGGWPT